MHAGDAVWILYAELTMLERRYSTSPSTLELLGKMREALKVVGEFVIIDPPPADKMQQLIEMVTAGMLPPVDELPSELPQHEQKQSQGGTDRINFSDPERIEAAKEILEEMVGSGKFDWADMVDSINTQVNGNKPFISDRQFKAIVNIGRRQDHGEFWDQLSDDYQTSVKLAEEAAERVG